MKTTTRLAAVLLLAASVPHAQADVPLFRTCAEYDSWGGINLWSINEFFYFPFNEVQVDSFGVPIPDGSVWQESNGHFGFDCEEFTLFDGTVVPPDTRLI